jgi:putative methionine-R-sulfoxide reductase with GAF domain
MRINRRPKGENDRDRVRREARVAGLREFRTPSLEAVEQRRLQLWALVSIVLLAVAAGVVAFSTWNGDREAVVLSAPIVRIAVLLLSGGFCLYAVEKEIHLQRLARLLTDERVLTAALTNRLHEVSLLLDAGKAMNSVLELPAVLETILRSATELLDAGGGSVMLLDDDEDELVAVSVRGRAEAHGSRVRVGEGIAGHVAIRREAILIQGPADPLEFPGLAERDPYVESAMSVPLLHRDELLGVLNVNAAVAIAFTQYDLRAMSIFAEQAAAAIANARLFESEREHASELRRLRLAAGGEF